MVLKDNGNSRELQNSFWLGLALNRTLIFREQRKTLNSIREIDYSDSGVGIDNTAWTWLRVDGCVGGIPVFELKNQSSHSMFAGRH